MTCVRKVALVTGGAAGIGDAIVGELLADGGWTVQGINQSPDWLQSGKPGA